MPDIVAWIEANRRLSIVSSSEVGMKRMSRTPFFKPILADMVDDNVKEIVIMKSAQIGATDLCVDFLGYLAANDPCPVAFFLADEKTSKRIFKDRVQEFFKTNPILHSLRIEGKKTQNSELYLRNGFNLIMTYASSIAQTASKSFRVLIMDEIDKNGYQIVGQEGSTLGRIKERTESYENYKLIKLSTPTTDNGLIYKELQKCDVVYDWFVPCPKCGEYQPLRFEQETYKAEGREFVSGRVVWEGSKEATPQMIEDSARYECAFCKELWTGYEKNNAVEKGKCVSQKPVVGKVIKKGYSYWRGISCLAGGSLARIVQSYLDCKDDPGDLQNFVNSACGQPYIQKAVKLTIAEFEILKKPIPHNTVPNNTIALIAGIDSQHTGVWYVVRAFNPSGGSLLIDYGYLPGDNDDEQLENLLYEREYLGVDGKKWKIWRAFRDVGGGDDKDTKVSITERVMIWLRNNKNRGVQLFGCRGANMAMEQRVKLSKPTDTTPSGKALRGSIQLARIDTTKMKDALYYRLELARRGEENGAYLNQDVEEIWFNHITAEEKRIVKGKEKWVLIRPNNHLLDCDTYAHSAAERCFLGGIGALKRPMYSGKTRRIPDQPAQPAVIQPVQERASPLQTPVIRPNVSESSNPYLTRR
jgi:phage terminase large subunit GpA-like protein